MKKVSNIVFIILISFLFSGCATFLLFTGTVVGGVYVAKEVESDYNGDLGEFVKDKSNKAYDAVTGE